MLRPSRRLLAAACGLFAAAGAAGQDVGQALHVGARDDLLAALVTLAEAVDQLGAQDVDLAVQDAPAVGDVDFLFGELLDEVLQLLVRQRAKVRERVHSGPSPPGGRAARGEQRTATHQAQLEGAARVAAIASRVYMTAAISESARPT